MKIFGREPAVYTGLLAAVLALVVSIDKFDFSAEEAAAIMGVIFAVLGVYTAWVTDQTLLGVFIGLAEAVIACAAVYGFDLTVDQTGAVMALITSAAGFAQRTQVSPAATPSLTGIRAP